MFAKIVMKGGQIFAGTVDQLTTEGIILDGYCTRLCYEDMIYCRDEKLEINMLKPWEEPTHVLVTVTGEPILRGSLEECRGMLDVIRHRYFYKILKTL